MFTFDASKQNIGLIIRDSISTRDLFLTGFRVSLALLLFGMFTLAF